MRTSVLLILSVLWTVSSCKGRRMIKMTVNGEVVVRGGSYEYDVDDVVVGCSAKVDLRPLTPSVAPPIKLQLYQNAELFKSNDFFYLNDILHSTTTLEATLNDGDSFRCLVKGKHGNEVFEVVQITVKKRPEKIQESTTILEERHTTEPPAPRRVKPAILKERHTTEPPAPRRVKPDSGCGEWVWVSAALSLLLGAGTGLGMIAVLRERSLRKYRADSNNKSGPADSSSELEHLYSVPFEREILQAFGAGPLQQRLYN